MFPEILILFMSLLNTSTCAPSTAVYRNDSGGPRCYSCASVKEPYHCNVTTQCGSDEQCYTDEYATSPGSRVFKVGCRRISECYSAIVRRSVSRKSDEERLKCKECCHGNLCNNGGCSSGPPKGNVCYKCSFITDPRRCEHETRCLADEQCFIEKVLTQNFRVKYTLGCVDNVECETLHHFGRAVRKRDLVLSTMCASCCQGDKCNNECSPQGFETDTPETSVETTHTSLEGTSPSVTDNGFFSDTTSAMPYTKPSMTDYATVIDTGMPYSRLPVSQNTISFDTREIPHSSPLMTKDTTSTGTTSEITYTSPVNAIETTYDYTTSATPYTSPSKTKDTTSTGTTSEITYTSALKATRTTFVDITSAISHTSPSRTKDTTLIDATSEMPYKSPSMTEETPTVDRSATPYTSPSKTKDTPSSDTTSEVTYTSSVKAIETTYDYTTSAIPSTSPSKTKVTTSTDTTSEITCTSPLKTTETTPMDITSDISHISPLRTKDTTLIDATSEMPYKSPSMTKETPTVDRSATPYTSPSKTKDTTLTDAISDISYTSHLITKDTAIIDTTIDGIQFSPLPGSSVHAVTTSLSSGTASSASTHDSHHSGLLCSFCDRVTDPRDCKYTTICGAGQECHVAKYATARGYIYYKLGCMTDQECQALRVGRRENEAALEERCCTNHSGCNRDIFKSPNGLTCGSCEGMASPADCEKVASCSASEVCARTVYASDQFFVRYTLQCINRVACGGRVLHRALYDDENKDLCCDTSYCNMAQSTKFATVTSGGSTNTATPTPAI